MRRTAWLPVLGVLAGAPVAAQTITTVAGSGIQGFCGDGGAATSACLSMPKAVAVDGAGNLLIADYDNNRVRRVTLAGVISTFAGKATPGYCGDGGPATSACLLNPTSVAVDAAGNLFIADQSNNRVRKVNTSGIITTVAGTGVSGFSGDGGLATSAKLSYPWGIALDTAGNLFISDRNNARVRKVAAATGIITTVAGNGSLSVCGDGGPATSACLGSIFAVVVAPEGDLYISSHGRVRKVIAATGVITSVAGGGGIGFCGDGGPATAACLSTARGIALERSGDLLIADTENHRVRRVDGDGIITTAVGIGSPTFCGDGGPATSACIHYPASVTVDAGGNLYIADNSNHRVRKVAAGLASLRLSKTLVAGCLKVTGKLTLSAPAPAGGLMVGLTSDNPHAVVPASVRVNEGLATKSLSISTRAVAATEAARILASIPGDTLSTVLTIRPIGPKSVTLSPNPVTGGGAATGTLTLECAAGPGDIHVSLSSTKPAASPDVTALEVPYGTKAVTFGVTTTPVPVVTKPTLKATANGITKSKVLVVNPG